MNDYTYEQIILGQKEQFEVTVTDSMMEQFMMLSGDINPLHVDRAYAAAHGFPDRVVYGLLTSSFYSTLAGVYLPGKRCLLYGLDVALRKPVFVGERLTVCGIVSEKNDTFRMITLKVHIMNQTGEKVSKGQLTVGFVNMETEGR